MGTPSPSLSPRQASSPGPLAPSFSLARGANPAEAAERALMALDAALRATESVLNMLKGQGPPGAETRVAVVRQQPEGAALLAAFETAWVQANAGRQQCQAALKVAKEAKGPLARSQALAALKLPALQGQAKALFVAAHALRANPHLGPFLPAALGLAPAAAPLAPAMPSPQPELLAPGTHCAPHTPGAPGTASPPQRPSPPATAHAAGLPGTSGAPGTPGPRPEAGRLASPAPTSAPPLSGPMLEALKVVEPVHSYTAARLPFLACALSGPQGEAPTPPPGGELVVQALALLFAQQAQASMDARQALVQATELRRGILTARQNPLGPVSPAKLRGLAIPLTGFPRRFAPYPVLRELFPPLTPG